MKKTFYLFLVLGWIVLGACTTRASIDFMDSVRANKNSASLLEWENSEANPKKVFQKYREELKENPKLGNEVCEGLQKLSPLDLSIFEEEINKAENKELLESCQASLKKTLDDYWLDQKKSLEQSTLNFRFQPRTLKRDLSQGYRAKTGDVDPKEIILTFDDGPDPIYSPKILDILKLVDAKAMYFLQGDKVPLYPEILRRQAEEGHIIGSHSLTHHCLANTPSCLRANGGTPLSYDQAVVEIRGGHQAIYNVLGFVDPFFRFPYGESDPDLSQFLATHQAAQFHWTIESADWKAQSNEELLADTLRQLDRVQRGIVLFHDTQRRTSEILPEFLRALYDRGYNLVVLQSMDEQARYNSPLVTKTPFIP